MIAKTKIFNDIERLRGFACILVFIQHAAWICQLRFIYEIVPTFLLFGSGAVHIFFAISGFVITLSFKDKFSSQPDGFFLDRVRAAGKILLSFYKRRFFRIFPVVFLVAILLGIFYGATEDDFSWIPSLLRAPFEILFGAYSNSVELFVSQEKIHKGGIGPFWTLAVEAQFYILWPIVLLACKNNNARALVSLFLGCLFLFVVCPLSEAFLGRKYYLIHNNLSELFLGSFFAFLYREECSQLLSKKIALLISSVLALLIWFYPSSVNSSYFTEIVVSLSSVFIVVLAAFAEGSFAIPFLGRIFDFLGSRSFSFYSLQLVLMNITVWYTNSIYFPKESLSEYEFFFYQFAMLVALLLVATELVYRFVEKPVRQLGCR
ncbi:MAG: acyltransferase [Holosporaceae bacterium]|jgi:peptidoglycan/LPS O-acetylase OafA/YrhL|nr:acyltransferase [Holosporaceae bacterium]